jgi:ABC-type Na+ efflux pump permease subunit
MVPGTEASSPAEGYDWDIFLAHAGADASVAEELYELLEPCKVFLASRSLLLGDDWDRELARAQQRSLITVVLVAARTDTAYYQREEVAAALDMARADGSRHRVVPVYLQNGHAVPYGLRLKHGLSLPDCGGLTGVSRRLIDLVGRLKNWDRQIVEPQKRALSKLTARPPRDRLAGVLEVTQLFRPVILTLLAILAIAALLMFVSLMTPSFETRTLAVSILSSLIFLILTFLLIAFLVLTVAQQIVETGAHHD